MLLTLTPLMAQRNRQPRRRPPVANHLVSVRRRVLDTAAVLRPAHAPVRQVVVPGDVGAVEFKRGGGAVAEGPELWEVVSRGSFVVVVEGRDGLLVRGVLRGLAGGLVGLVGSRLWCR